MRHLVESRNLQKIIKIDSAGTIGYHTGNRPDERMTRAAQMRGIQLMGSARQINIEDIELFDLIIAMDRDNLYDIQSMAGIEPENVKLLSDFLPDGSAIDVPDPYYGGEAGFHLVLDMIEEACPNILEKLLEK